MKTLALKKIRHKGGFEYIAPTNRLGLSSHKTPSSAVVLEDGEPLPGPANAPHDDIRNFGCGRYSLWFGKVRFSTSDNSDPRTNGRSYSVQYEEIEERRFGGLTGIVYVLIMLLHQPFLPVSLKNALMEIGHGVESVRHLRLTFPFWSLYYWLSFFYVLVIRDKKQD